MIKCSFCKLDQEEKFFYKNKSSKTGFDHICKTCRKERYDHSYEAHKEYNRRYDKERRKTEKRKQFLLQYDFPKYNKNIYYKNDYRKRIRGVLKTVLRSRGIKKTQSSEKLLGYTLQDFKNKFGEIIPKNYHIDHIIPVSWFCETAPMNIINNLNNLQLLLGTKNLKKNNTYSDTVLFSYYRKILPFIKRELRKQISYKD